VLLARLFFFKRLHYSLLRPLSPVSCNLLDTFSACRLFSLLISRRWQDPGARGNMQQEESLEMAGTVFLILQEPNSKITAWVKAFFISPQRVVTWSIIVLA